MNRGRANVGEHCWTCEAHAYTSTRLFSVCLPVRSQGVGVLHSRLPASLFEHVSMGQDRNPPTQRTTLCVFFVLSGPLCVIIKETGLSPLARTFTRTWVFLKRFHIQALRSLCLIPLTSVTSFFNFVCNFTCDISFLLRVFQRVFSALQGATCADSRTHADASSSSLTN